jgi:hypothetical protein
MAEIDDIKSFANYLPHVLFAIAQILCGTFFIFLIIPSASYLISSNFNFQNLLKMYTPNFGIAYYQLHPFLIYLSGWDFLFP